MPFIENQSSAAMNPKNKTQPSQNLTNGTGQTEACVRQFFGFINQYCSQDGYEKLKNLCAEREKFKSELEKKDEEYQTSLRQLGKQGCELGQKAEQVQKLEAANASLGDEISKLKDELNTMIQQRKAEADEFTKLNQIAKQHETTKLDLRQALADKEKLEKSLKEKEGFAQQLEEIRSHSVNIISCNLLKENSLCLTSIANEGSQWAKDFLFQDLEPTSFTPEKWNTVKSAGTVKEFGAPLPASNTLAAKQVRYAIGLFVLGKALQRYISQPLYLSEDPEETANFLELLESKPVVQQAYARSVLLKALEDEQGRIGEIRAKNAAQKVMDTLRDLIPAEKREACSSAVLRICHNALKKWKQVQRVKETVEVKFKCSVGDFERWQLLELPSELEPAVAPPTRKNNKSDTQTKPGSKVVTTQNQGNAPKDPTVADLNTVDVDVYEVWPLLFVGDKLLHPGLVFTGEHFMAAEKEAFEEIKKEEYQRRSARRKERQSSESASNGNDSKRRNSNAFLSLGGGTDKKSK